MPTEPKTETEHVREVLRRELKILLPGMQLQYTGGTWKRSECVIQVVPDVD